MNFAEAGKNPDKMRSAIKEKWQQLFEIEEELEDDASFFELGGNSLLAGIFFADVERQLNVKVPISEIYDHENADVLADRIVEILESEGV